MAALIRIALDAYGQFDKYGDPTTTQWYLIRNPLVVLTMMAFYVYFSTSFGPRFMKNRQPYDLKNVVRVFNILQILVNSYLFLQVSYHGWIRYKLICEPVVRYNEDHHQYKVKLLCWYFMIVKLSDFLDTVFFILRKKAEHVSYLHLIHHTGMPAVAYFGTRFVPGGHLTFLGFINTFVHTVMYTYYFIASLGPEYKKYLWWKKYLTLLQIIQFFLVFLHSLSAVIFDCDVPVPRLLVLYYLPQPIFMTLMFSSFYYNTYIKKKTSKYTAAPPKLVYDWGSKKNAIFRTICHMILKTTPEVQ